jgi:phosphatidylserine/phosphatidylglycerophosphate/cardiolipin synthase-like enzyme
MDTSAPPPWDVGCKVTTLIGGYAAMSEMRDQLEALIDAAKSSSAVPGSRGHVYIAGWRFNCQRDLSSQNSWKTGWWGDVNTSDKDQTAIGLVLRLMQHGIAVRILVWFPTIVEELAAKMTPHLQDHTYLWRVVQKENARLDTLYNPVVPLGIVGLDKRTASGSVAGAHHQKMMIIRSPTINVAFCGGVDLAFSRRDAPTDPSSFTPERVLGGDWQSGTSIPALYPMPPGITWPPQADATTDYTKSASTKWDVQYKQGSDLPTTTDSQDVCLAIGKEWNGTCSYQRPDGKPGPSMVYGDSYQYWHDQHLKLEGPIVSTLEWQFAERWIDSPFMDKPVVRGLEQLYKLDPFQLTGNLLDGAVGFSTERAYTPSSSGGLAEDSKVVPLETPVDIAQSVGPSIVQMWRTIPMRDDRTTDPFKDGEFTIMAGISKAISKANELIWIFDQYFWSEPAARLLNYQLQNSATVCVLIILPPHADQTFPEEHRARQLALTELTQGLTADQRARVAIYNMWNPQGGNPADGRGIYVHAKAHTYDGALLVCGSANMNRRSLTCDSELACAVVDADVVAGHQKKLWNMMFANVTGPEGAWPKALDFNQSSGNGRAFLTKFAAAAASRGAYLIPDPWDDDNPLNPTPKTVALPNDVPRPVAFLGPKYELMYSLTLDPGSLKPEVENDVLVRSTSIPRPARLDDVVRRVEYVDPKIPGSPRYPWRKAARRLAQQVIHLAGIRYYAGGSHYTETAQWFKQVCAGLPCFFAIGWPGYKTTVFEHIQIDGQDVVIQPWKGWCQRFAGLNGLPGGVGAEVGVYRRIPGQFTKFMKQDGALDFIKKYLKSHPEVPPGQQSSSYLDQVMQTADSLVWWPFPELNAKVSFTLQNPTTDETIFHAGPENTYWLCKWMAPDDYDKYADVPANQVPKRFDFQNIADFTLTFRVSGQTSLFSTTWKKGDGNQTWPP